MSLRSRIANAIDGNDAAQSLARIADCLEYMVYAQHGYRLGKMVVEGKEGGEPEVSFSTDRETLKNELLDIRDGREFDRPIDVDEG